MLLAIVEFPSLIYIPIEYTQIIVVVRIRILYLLFSLSLSPFLPLPLSFHYVQTHGAIEFLLLTYIGVGIMLRVTWMKPKTFLKQRTLIVVCNPHVIIKVPPLLHHYNIYIY